MTASGAGGAFRKVRDLLSRRAAEQSGIQDRSNRIRTEQDRLPGLFFEFETDTQQRKAVLDGHQQVQRHLVVAWRHSGREYRPGNARPPRELNEGRHRSKAASPPGSGLFPFQDI